MINTLYPLLHNHTFHTLLENGLTEDYLAATDRHPDLVNILVDLQEWELWKTGLLRPHTTTAFVGFRHHVAQFEEQKPNLNKSIAKHLKHLTRHLRSLPLTP